MECCGARRKPPTDASRCLHCGVLMEPEKGRRVAFQGVVVAFDSLYCQQAFWNAWCAAIRAQAAT